jgi:predicted acetyltransferase
MPRIRAVTVTAMPLAEKSLLDRLLQLYLHDFSDFAELGTTYAEVDNAGIFPYPPGTDDYWRQDGNMPLLIRADGRTAGFALVNRWSPLDRAVEHALAEFFVLRKYRRAGIGRRAALQIFDRYPGRWELGVASYNPAALSFWRSVATALPGSTEAAGDGSRWRGTVLCFTAGPAP